MTFPSTSTNTLLSIYLTLGQYPILSIRLRQRMRRELFERGVIQPQAFEAEVIERAQRSQRAEGLLDPVGEETTELWNLRVTRVRERLTDLLFSQHFNFDLFETLLKEELGARGINEDTHALSINPELAPLELVFEQAMTIERMPEEERARYDARLQESKVVLIRSLISDQLRYINIARDVFTISDLAEIRQRKIGAGRIGGKAAGMLLAYRVLQETADPSLLENLQVAESYFIGSDEFYNFMAINNLVRWNDQKYKSEEEMRAEYPQILAEYECGEFTPDIIERLQTLLANAADKPLIVRSSSLLEDNFGTSFAGKYDSIFLPNQASMGENLEALKRAIAHIYGSTLNPAALLYRRSKGLLDYDERMAILIQVVQGQPYGRYFLPHGAGVAFSRNLYRWAPQIRREDGFVRLVWGLGTRAVDRVGNDYPRLIALSHPLLRPSNDPRSVRRYSQQFVDLIDLQDNQFKTLPVHDVLQGDYPPLRYLAQIENDGFFTSLRSSIIPDDPQELVLTFEDLLSRTSFAGM
ncbi:MAG TPA: PEP/pyruvate-binding domain-containing protein, partial [Longilinea sp.]|nr:PEP/pyruvate-binding domain-containing protein [Longilinea sp.]